MTHLHPLLKDGKFLSIEISPPLNKDLSEFASNEVLKDIYPKANNIIITDGPLGKATQNSIKASIFFKKESGLNTIATFALRNKKVADALSEIKNANLVGFGDYMFLTGDKAADGPSVIEKNSIKFTYDVVELDDTLDDKLSVFATCSNTLSDAVEKKIRKKIKAGTQALVSQPCKTVYEAVLLRSFINECNAEFGTNCYFIAGVFPVDNFKTAKFIRNKIPGADINNELYDLLESNELDEAMSFNKRFFNELRERGFNIHLMTANNFTLMKDILS